MTRNAPPPGFAPWEGRGGFAAHVGPYWRREVEPGSSALAFLADDRHVNGLGLLHGGMLSAFMDTLLANAVIGQARGPVVTVHLAVDYLSMGRGGRWVVGEGRVTRLAADLAFAEGRAAVDGRDIVRATGVFKVMARRAQD